jgi:ubiquinone/menaquinone biosynthesis C-methylase UbiE
MKISDAYTAWAATYDTMENPVRDLDQVVMQETLGQRRFGSIIEVGCGTGKNTALLAQIGKQVQAIDFSEGMMAKARTKIQQPHVTFTAGDITERWPYADESADLVTINLVLEHVTDLAFVFGEAHRCLRVGGSLFVCELHPFRQYQGLQANFTGEEGQIAVEAFVHHIGDFWDAGIQSGFTCRDLREWWRDRNSGKPPLLVSFLFQK